MACDSMHQRTERIQLAFLRMLREDRGQARTGCAAPRSVAEVISIRRNAEPAGRRPCHCGGKRKECAAKR